MTTEDRKAIIEAIREGFKQAGKGRGTSTYNTGPSTTGGGKAAASAFLDKFKDLPGIGEAAAAAGQALEGVSTQSTELAINLDRALSSLNVLQNAMKNAAATTTATRNSFNLFGADMSTVFKNLEDEIDTTTNEMIRFGEKTFLSAEAGRAAVEKLSTTFGGFFGLNQTGQVQLAQTSMLMESVGFSAGQVSTIFDKATRSFGMSADQTAALGGTLANLRVQYKMSAEDIEKNFIQAQDKLIYNSDRVLDVFTKLQAKSRITGIDFGELTTAFGESYDTFEGAAGKVGNLNALLGDNIFNSLDMLGKDEAQRMETIVTGIKDNVNVNTLVSDKFQLKAVANQLGLSPDQTRRLLLGETGVQKMLEDKITTPEQLKVENAQDAINQLTATFNASLPPLIKFQKRLAEELQTFKVGDEMLSGIIEKTIGTAGSEQLLKAFKEAKAKTNLATATMGLANMKAQGMSFENASADDIVKSGFGNTDKERSGGQQLPKGELLKMILNNTGAPESFLKGFLLVGQQIAPKAFQALAAAAMFGDPKTIAPAYKALKDSIAEAKEKSKEDKDKPKPDEDGSPEVGGDSPTTATMVRLAPGTIFEFTGFDGVTGKLFAKIAGE